MSIFRRGYDVAKASLHKSLLTSHEREYLIHKSLNAHSINESAIKDALIQYETRKQKEEEQNRLQQRFNLGLSSRYVPISGCIRGDHWSKYMKSFLTSNENAVVHTVIFPEGKTSQDISFYNVNVQALKKYTCDPGVLPDTMTRPTQTFEAYVERDCITEKFCLPEHFVVVQATKPPDCRDMTLRSEHKKLNENRLIKAQKEFAYKNRVFVK